MNIVHADFQGTDITFSGDGWFNATSAAAKFGKRPVDWLEQRDTAEYLAALADSEGKSGFLEQFNEISQLKGERAASQAKLLRLSKDTGFVRAKAGSPENGGGTWMHPKLGVVFARWLDVRFAVWCDEQIDKLLRGQVDWKRARHEASATYKGMCDVLRLVREEEGKSTASYHYANEARLVNRVITGEWGGLDRDALSLTALDLLAKLEAKNLVLLARGVGREERAKALESMAMAWNQKALASAA